MAPRRVETMYRPSGERGEIIVYAGHLNVTVGDETRTVQGQVELRLGAGPLVAHFAGPPSRDMSFLTWADDATVAVPMSAALVPPSATILPERSEVDTEILISSSLAGGVAAQAERFVFHVSGALDGRSFSRTDVVNDRSQQQLRFRLAGWDLVMAPLDDPCGEADFAFVIEAQPQAPTADIEVAELAVLHALDYQGPYGSRLRLARQDADVDQVPWSTALRGG